MNNDAEYQAIRAKRMAELQGNQNFNGQNKEAMEEEQQRQDMKNNILLTILDQSARARLNTIMVAKPEKGRMLENIILQMAQRGQIQTQLSEDALRNLLIKINAQFENKRTTVKFDRRRALMDDSEEELDV